MFYCVMCYYTARAMNAAIFCGANKQAFNLMVSRYRTFFDGTVMLPPHRCEGQAKRNWPDRGWRSKFSGIAFP
jgi:hypothetical protein